MSQVAIIGAGKIGQAVGGVIKDNNNTVEYWDKKPEFNTKSLESVVKPADYVFICVPSWAVREVLGEIKPFLNSNSPLISLSKGIEKETLKTVDEIIKEILPNQPFGLLAGPMLADEIKAGQPGNGILASYGQQTFDKINLLFENTRISIKYKDDVRGVALSSCLKNIYAIGLGMAEALNMEDDFRGNYVTKAINEMSEIIVALGGKKDTPYDLSGLGDLIATGSSPSSKNFSVGEDIIEENKVGNSEGTVAIEAISKLLDNKRIKYPTIFSSLHSIILDKADPKTVFGKTLPLA